MMMNGTFTTAHAENLGQRRRISRLGITIVVAVSAVSALMVAWFLVGILNDSFGMIVVTYEVTPPSDLDEMNSDAIAELIRTGARAGVVRRFEQTDPLEERSRRELRGIADRFVFQPSIERAWSLSQSLSQRAEIEEFAQEVGGYVQFRAWVSPDLILNPIERNPLQSGIRTALVGSLWIVALSLAIAFPIGVATAIYLNEYTSDSSFSRFLRANIETMASVPSIIYGILGLALFVRVLGPFTSGTALGAGEGGSVGRTILSAGLTLSILVLPTIVISVRDLLENIPDSYREACYAVGGRRSTIIFRRLVPSIAGQLVTVLFAGISRVIGETAPLLVVGAAAFITVDPTSVFSRFTALPAQIFFWSARPQAGYRNLAAGAIVVLVILSIGINIGLALIRRRLDLQASLGTERNV